MPRYIVRSSRFYRTDGSRDGSFVVANVFGDKLIRAKPILGHVRFTVDFMLRQMKHGVCEERLVVSALV